jgi:hypothetical protein
MAAKAINKKYCPRFISKTSEISNELSVSSLVFHIAPLHKMATRGINKKYCLRFISIKAVGDISETTQG